MSERNGHEVIEAQTRGLSRVDAATRAEVDLQVSTAKAFPRQLRRVMNDAKSMATVSQEIAEGCIYSYRRGGNDITGPSVRLAEILATCWGNLRCQTRLGEETGNSISAIGTAWDMEKNVLIQSECRRSIEGRDGDRYSADMVAVTANAAASIALRNAIFRVIPRAIVEEVYAEARAAAVGDLKSLAERRQRALDTFAAMGVSAERVFERLGITDAREVTLEHLVVLTGVRTALRDGERMLEDEFPEPDDAPAKKPPKSAPSDADLAARVRGDVKPGVTVVVKGGPSEEDGAAEAPQEEG